MTIVRAFLLPSAMKLFGRWNWWLPARIARVFRVEPLPASAGDEGARQAREQLIHDRA